MAVNWPKDGAHSLSGFGAAADARRALGYDSDSQRAPWPQASQPDGGAPTERWGYVDLTMTDRLTGNMVYVHDVVEGWVSLANGEVHAPTEVSERLPVDVYRASEWPGFVVSPQGGMGAAHAWEFKITREVTGQPQWIVLWRWRRGGSPWHVGGSNGEPVFPLFAGR